MNKIIKVGDKVKVVKKCLSCDPYSVGDVLTVTGTDCDGDITFTKEHGEQCVLSDEVEVIKQEAKAGDDMQTIKINGKDYKLVEVEEELKEGDYVVRKEGVDVTYSITNEDMNLGKIMSASINTMYVRVVAHEGVRHEAKQRMGHMVSNKYFRKATEEEINKYKNGNPKHKIKVGDYVKSELGRFYEIEEVSADFLRAVRAKCIRSGVYYSFFFKEVTKVEPTERQLSFIRAGREINHVKAGDVISNFLGLTISGFDTKDAITTTLVCPVDERYDTH